MKWPSVQHSSCWAASDALRRGRGLQREEPINCLFIKHEIACSGIADVVKRLSAKAVEPFGYEKAQLTLKEIVEKSECLFCIVIRRSDPRQTFSVIILVDDFLPGHPLR